MPRKNPVLTRLAIACRDLAWEGALIVKFVRTGERKARVEQINPSLAQVLAGQVAAGLAKGDADPAMCLFAIGLMLRNATDDDVTHRVLDIAGATTATRSDSGVVVSLPLA